MPTEAIAKRLLKIFGARTDVYALAHFDGANVTYRLYHAPLTLELVSRHLHNELILGTYALSPQNTVRWLGWDVDAPDLKQAKTAAQQIIDVLGHVPHNVEFTGGRGYHILIFLNQEVPAAQAKAIAEAIRSVAGLPATGATHCECYPKQTQLTAANPYGSLLKLPLGQHPRTHEQSRFVDPRNGWEAAEDIDPLVALHNVVQWNRLRTAIQGAAPEQSLVRLLSPFWKTGDRHQLALALAGYLAGIGWGLEQTKELVRDVAAANNDSEVENRIACVVDTFTKVHNNQPVAGYSLLSDMLSGGAMQQLVSLTTQIATPNTVQRIDTLRLGAKVPQYLRVRQAGGAVWSDLLGKGRFIQAGIEIYYFQQETHLLVPSSTKQFSYLLHKNYGLNPTASFDRQVLAALELRCVGESPQVSVHSRSHWDGSKLFISLKGPEVYVLDGEKIDLAANGDCGHFFTTDRAATKLDTTYTVSAGTAWNILVDNLNLHSSADAPASPAQQRELLKAWILNSFFPELAPTKPILVCIGVPGSGKTTAMRRLVRILEGPDQDVLALVEDKPDALRVSLTNRQLLVLDNIENIQRHWIADMLDRISTGSIIELRKLYTTGEVYRIVPNCFVALTAVAMPATDEALANRLLPLEFERLQNPIAEYLLQQHLMQQFEHIWLDLLQILNRVVAQLRTTKLNSVQLQPNLVQHRMADFVLFCGLCGQAGVLDQQLLFEGLQTLSYRQQATLAKSSVFVTAVEIWVGSTGEQQRSQSLTTKQLFTALQPIARSSHLGWRWRTPAALGRHLSAISEVLVAAGCKIEEHWDSRHARRVKTYNFAGWRSI